ncbi:MAG: ABC transporter permease subunit [Planctomycetota bacterium]
MTDPAEQRRPPRDEPLDRLAGSRRVRATDRLATIVITAGGLSVVAAVLGICVYLASVTIPLLAGGEATVEAKQIATSDRQPDVASVRLDEYLASFELVRQDGTAEHRSLLGGAVRSEHDGDAAAASQGRVVGSDALAGTTIVDTGSSLRVRSSEFGYTIVSGDADVPDSAVAETRSDGRRRLTRLGWNLVGEVPHSTRFIAADTHVYRNRTVLAAVDERGVLSVWAFERSRSLLGDGAVGEARELDATAVPAVPDPASVLLLADGDAVIVGSDGSYVRASLSRRAAVGIEQGSLWEADSDERVTAVTPLIGRGTFVVGTSAGRVGSWWVALDPDDSSAPGRVVAGPELPSASDGIVALAASLRDRSVFVADASGAVRVINASSGKVVARVAMDAPAVAVSAAPKLDGFLIATPAGGTLVSLDVGHPTVTPRSLFVPMLYEGQAEAGFVYQASGGSDAAEPKLSLVPLIFGTLKATLVSMLFAAPVAIFAAVFTSEFASARFRRVIKPVIETMASLPSVVLGFVAAMVVAPFVAEHLSSVLTGLVLVPTIVLVVSGIAGLFAGPTSEARGTETLPVLVLVACVVGVAVSVFVAPSLERSLFGPNEADLLLLAGGDAAAALSEAAPEVRDRAATLGAEFARPTAAVRSWLGGVYGGPAPGWFALLSPALALACALLVWPALVAFRPELRRSRWGPLSRILISTIAGCALAAPIALALSSAGVDPRDSVLGVFTQRNTLVIGVIMGLAIIPIIFTISDDALQSVPSHLRAASFGAGATRWQTTARIVLPVAASGIFSATMIGLGRAVGETMIVLMATGNTPIMDWNIFEGLRTLSANIAVELPEAERGGTHYRLLFLCGVVLFLMTFVINTTAEIVRQRFRKRNALL